MFCLLVTADMGLNMPNMVSGSLFLLLAAAAEQNYLGKLEWSILSRDDGEFFLSR